MVSAPHAFINTERSEENDEVHRIFVQLFLILYVGKFFGAKQRHIYRNIIMQSVKKL